MAIAAPGQLNVTESPEWGSRSINCFEKLEIIGEGSYGRVYKGKEIETGEIVALKQIRMDKEKEGFPITAIREIKILKKLHHENIIKLKEIVTSPGAGEKDEQARPDGNMYKGGIYMVFEYMDHDLKGLARAAMGFSVPQIKCYMKQLLTGLHLCHVNEVLHRDMKSSNLLIDGEGNLKLGDFGLSRSFSNNHNGNLTNLVVTLWYRPPELLLGTTKYGPAVDMWSVGCVFAELLCGEPIFQGNNEADQINKIFEICGAPDDNNWPGVSKMRWYNNFKPSRPLKRRVREKFRDLDRHALELLDKMLTLDPSQRISAKDALNAEYFWTDPLPCDPKSLPKYESSHELVTKRKRQQQLQHDERAKRPKLQQHNRLPPPIQQTGQVHNQMHGRPSQPVHGSQQLQLPTGPSHHYMQPSGASGGANRYNQGGGNHSSGGGGGGGYNHPNRGGQAGGYGSLAYPPQGRVPLYGSRSVPGGSGPHGGYGSAGGGNPGFGGYGHLNGGQAGGYGSGSYPPQALVPPYGAGNVPGVSGPHHVGGHYSGGGHYGGSVGGGPPSYSGGGHYGGSVGGAWGGSGGWNPNQQHGWHQ